MIKLLLSVWLLSCGAVALARAPAADAGTGADATTATTATTTTAAALRQQVNAFVDAWHDDAAHARPAYFDKMSADGVYIGTDKTELWQRDAFKAWAKRFFDRGAAWSFKATRRNVYFSDDRQVIWFDELLDTQMGVCQASGVIRVTPDGLRIAHYQLSIAVPNDVASGVTQTIRQFETGAAAEVAAKTGGK